MELKSWPFLVANNTFVNVVDVMVCINLALAMSYLNTLFQQTRHEKISAHILYPLHVLTAPGVSSSGNLIVL